MFVGGRNEVFERWQSLLTSRNVVHLGAVDSGNVTKLVNNVMMYINFAGACEGMTMGVKAGDPRAPLEVINSIRAAS